jgi:hypothetical protein
MENKQDKYHKKRNHINCLENLRSILNGILRPLLLALEQIGKNIRWVDDGPVMMSRQQRERERERERERGEDCCR